jgi:hypothetical protein
MKKNNETLTKARPNKGFSDKLKANASDERLVINCNGCA